MQAVCAFLPNIIANYVLCTVTALLTLLVLLSVELIVISAYETSLSK